MLTKRPAPPPAVAPVDQHRLVILRLLLDDPRLDLAELDWAAVRTIAEHTGVIVRVADAVARRRGGEPLPPHLAESAARACGRTQRVLEIVDQLGAACTRQGIAHAVLKTAERYPDTGRDIDLLISAARRDTPILRSLPAIARRRTWRHRIAGSSTFTAAHGIVIDIWHGRLGSLGEHARFARLLLERARPVAVGVTSFVAPTPEDHLLLIAAQQMFTRPALRLADVYWTIATLKDRQLNWDYLFATALSMGIGAALGTYLRYVNRLYAHAFDRPLLADHVTTRFEGSVHDAERFPAPRIAARHYLQQIGATLESGRWHSAARLSLLPVVAAAALTHRRIR
ncbi:MAG TPA: nucleotidyltransferase family protein [Gemmatimonadales bacterium]|nr:nucleotidyltransferase family protein [Gemmatimonadales bacterium]